MSKKIKNTDPNYAPKFKVGDICIMPPSQFVEGLQTRQRYFRIEEIFKSKKDNGWIVAKTPHYRFQEIKLDSSHAGYSGCEHCEHWDKTHLIGSIETVDFETLQKKYKTEFNDIELSEISKFLALPYGEQLQALEDIDKLKRKLEIEAEKLSRKAYSMKRLKYRILEQFIKFHNLTKDEGDR